MNGCELAVILTMRDYFAAAALTGMLNSPTIYDDVTGLTEPQTAKYAYRLADAMVRERNAIPSPARTQDSP